MKELDSIVKSKTPLNDMYKMIPETKMKAFTRFAKMFGFNDKEIRKVLEDEMKRAGG